MDLTEEELLLVSKVAKWILENINIKPGDAASVIAEIKDKALDEWRKQ